MDPDASFRPPGSLPAAPLSPYAGPWSPRLAAHLLRRAGFGGSPADVARMAKLSPGDAVESLIRFPSTLSMAVSPGQLDDESMALQRPADLTPEQRMALAQTRRAQELANIEWWMSRMLGSPAPLQEKMTLFLHGHFATASGTKGIYGSDIVDQNNLLRAYALGNWRELTHAMVRDRAMLKWLDNARSVKAHPNENMARELMELFTLGIGHYSEQDVRESARAFTGYTFQRSTGQFYLNAAQHDDGSKTFLGQTGNFNGDDIVEIIFKQPACAEWFAGKILGFFLYSDPEPELIGALAALIRKNDYNMAPVMSTLFRSQVFYSERAYRALVKSPVEFVIGSYQLYGIEQVEPSVVPMLRRMGQLPFHPPSVKGWDGGSQWLNTQTLLARENFSSALVASPAMAPGKTWLLDALPSSGKAATQKLIGAILQGDASPAAALRLASYLDGTGTSADAALSAENFEERMRGAAYLTMAMPAYQLS
jgi:uncharacterized protein (DUF1800 family)